MSCMRLIFFFKTTYFVVEELDAVNAVDFDLKVKARKIDFDNQIIDCLNMTNCHY